MRIQLRHHLLAVLMLLGVLLPQISHAQQLEPLPIDPAIRMGTLPNGLTYIIRHNANPANRANFYIAQKVGSILEDENQRGLAHFLEHMAFNGTKNFPGKKLINFLESIGVQFGADLNAYTSFDETVYTLMDVPTDRGQAAIDSCLLIMHDWSCNIELLGSEIDEERGVIHEEWRMRDNAQMRMLESMLPQLFPNNKYAERMPIGTMEVVDHCEHQALRDFYHKWYRPDLQAIIVVGDLDAEYVEKKLKELFQDVPKPENAAERYYVEIADNEEPIVAIATDKEARTTNLAIAYKFDALPKEAKATIFGVVYNYLGSIAVSMINERFSEIARKPGAPFMQGGSYIYNYQGIAYDKMALNFIAIAKDGGLDPALKSLANEIARIDQHGFTASEYERARTNYLSSFESAYNERDKRKNIAFCDEYKDYFLNGGYIPGIEVEYELAKQVAENLKVEQVNELIQEYITDGKNLVISLTGPQKEGITYPNQSELLASFKRYYAEPVEPMVEEVVDTELISKELKPGKTKKVQENAAYGSTLLTLNNGVRVFIKKTDFKDDQILLSAVADGGTMLYEKPQDLMTIKAINSLIDLGGLGQFDETGLRKALTGRDVNLDLSVGSFTTDLSGSSSVRDFETMLKLVHLYMTDVRYDEEAFLALKEKTIEGLRMKQRDPMASLGDSLISLLYDNHPRVKNLTEEDWNMVNYRRALDIVKERTAAANGFTFYLVGNIDVATAQPLLEKYLGSLKKGKVVKRMDRTKTPMIRDGKKTMSVTKDFNTPTGVVFDAVKGSYAYNQKSILTAQILSNVLDQVLVASIREREGGTYSPSGNADIDEYPKQEASITIYFQADPDRAEELNAVVYKELQQLVDNGINQDYFDKAVAGMAKRHAQRVRENGYWLGQLRNNDYDKRDYVTNYDKILKEITPADVRDMVRVILNSGNDLRFYLLSNQREAKK